MKKSDETLSHPVISAIHNKIGEARDLHGRINDLAEREPALAAYVLFSGGGIAHAINQAGVSNEVAAQFRNEITFRMIVVIEAVRTAHYELWRYFMNDDPPPTESDGEKHA